MGVILSKATFPIIGTESSSKPRLNFFFVSYKHTDVDDVIKTFKLLLLITNFFDGFVEPNCL